MQILHGLVPISLKLKTINYKQKQAVHIVFDEDRFCHSRPLLERLTALNIYQINFF